MQQYGDLELNQLNHLLSHVVHLERENARKLKDVKYILLDQCCDYYILVDWKRNEK
jgi:hypothetical protein